MIVLKNCGLNVFLGVNDQRFVVCTNLPFITLLLIDRKRLLRSFSLALLHQPLLLPFLFWQFWPRHNISDKSASLLTKTFDKSIAKCLVILWVSYFIINLLVGRIVFLVSQLILIFETWRAFYDGTIIELLVLHNIRHLQNLHTILVVRYWYLVYFYIIIVLNSQLATIICITLPFFPVTVVESLFQRLHLFNEAHLLILFFKFKYYFQFVALYFSILEIFKLSPEIHTRLLDVRY